MDWSILVDGEMPLSELEAFVATRERIAPFTSRSDDGLERDLLDELRTALGLRLVRVGRHREALAHLPAERAEHLGRMLELRAQLEGATEPERPAALYALARFWYHHGRHILYFSNDWHQWAWNSHTARLTLEDRPDLADADRNMRAMTAETHALPLFETIIEHYPDSPEAPHALYSAACCWYWLVRPRYTTSCPYWQQRAVREDFMERGHRLMRRLQRTYPEHPLSRSEWIREHLPDTTGADASGE